MENGTDRQVAYWVEQVRAGRPITFVPGYYRPLVKAAVGLSAPARPRHPGWPALARVWFRGVAEPGRGEFLFTTDGGASFTEPWRPALAAALGGVRLGEVMVDAAVGRAILAKLDEAAASLARAKETERLRPDQSREMGLTAQLVRFQDTVDSLRPRTDRARAAAQKAILLQAAQSLADEDRSAVDDLSGSALTLDEKEAGVRLAPARPAPPVRPPTTTPPRPPAAEEGLPWWAYLGIGLGGLAALGGAIYLLAPTPAPAVAGAPWRGAP